MDFQDFFASLRPVVLLRSFYLAASALVSNTTPLVTCASLTGAAH
jgi:hypothetical protein